MKTFFKRKTVRRSIAVLAGLLLALLLFLPAHRDPSLADTQARVDYLAALGWEVDGGSEQEQQILLPESLDDVMERYNELQKQQGFDLEPYCGKEMSLYSYEVTNWPEAEATVLADLYVYKNRPVGGDIHSTALNGFMIALQ